MLNDPSSHPSIHDLTEAKVQARLKIDGYNKLSRPVRRTRAHAGGAAGFYQPSLRKNIPIRADFGVIELNEQAFARLRGPKALKIVSGASHLFPEPGALEAVIGHAGEWFERYLVPRRDAAATKN